PSLRRRALDLVRTRQGQKRTAAFPEAQRRKLTARPARARGAARPSPASASLWPSHADQETARRPAFVAPIRRERRSRNGMLLRSADQGGAGRWPLRRE